MACFAFAVTQQFVCSRGQTGLVIDGPDQAPSTRHRHKLADGRYLLSALKADAKFTAHAVNLILRQPRVTRRPSSANSLINVCPMRSQLATVSAIKILLIGVERLILAPQ